MTIITSTPAKLFEFEYKRARIVGEPVVQTDTAKVACLDHKQAETEAYQAVNTWNRAGRLEWLYWIDDPKIKEIER